MKSYPIIKYIFHTTAPVIHGGAALVAFFIAGARAAADPAIAAGSGKPETRTLFMGADFSVERGGGYFRVRDVTGSSFIILVGNKPVEISTREGTVPLRVQPSLKMTRTSVLVSDLKGERGYTPEHDPVRIFTRQMVHQENAAVQAAFAEEVADMATDGLNSVLQSNTRIGFGNVGAAPNAPLGVAPDGVKLLPKGGGLGGPGYAPYGSQEQLLLQENQQNINNSYGSSNQAEDNVGDPLGHDQFDAMEFNFELSSETKLNNPFIVIVTRFKEGQTPQGYARNHIFAQSLDPISDKPQKIHIIAGGFPPAFALIDYQIHLYNEGEEVASNVAKNRVEMSDNDAFEYLKMEYLGAHGDATLDAAPLMGLLPADLRMRLPRDEYAQTFYVKVSKEGLARETFLDRGCTKPAKDAYLESVMKDIRYKPALKNGKPVEGVAPVTLSRLSI